MGYPYGMRAVAQTLLEMPVEDALRRLLRSRATAMVRAMERARDHQDPDALHACRVAIRRLRALLRAYRRWLGRAAGKKLRRRLRDLGRATNPARDADMQLAWLAVEAPSLAPEDRPGLAWMRRRLRRQRRRSSGPGNARFERDLVRTVNRLRRRLRALDTGSGQTFGSAFFEVLVPTADRVNKRLAEISGPDDVKRVHRARIQVKRLRYLVQPVHHLSTKAREAEKRLRKLQNRLGDLHDLQLIEAELAAALDDAAREKARRLHALVIAGDARRLARARRQDERLGLAVLAGRAREQRHALYGKLDRQWLAGQAKALERELRSLLAREVPRAP